MTRLHHLPDRHAGFTLMEMSIVVAMIALVIGAVMMGNSYVRTSQIRAVLSQYDQYLKAIKEFQDKYQALPGDMNNATSLRGTDPYGCPAGYNAVARVATCNGDGNGTIGSSTTAGVLPYRIRRLLLQARQFADNREAVRGQGGCPGLVATVEPQRNSGFGE